VVAQSITGFNDPFGDQAFGAPPVSLPPPVATGDVNAWFNSLLNKERGIFYEDQYLQVQ
jgi:AP-2 complex subunit alpha